MKHLQHTMFVLVILATSIYINLRRSRDGPLTWSVYMFVCLFVRYVSVLSVLHSVRFGQLLCCADKHTVNIMKVYIERNDMQVKLIRFRKIYALFMYTFAKRGIQCNILIERNSRQLLSDVSIVTSLLSHLSHIVHHSIDDFRGACAVKGNVQVAGHVKRVDHGDAFNA